MRAESDTSGDLPPLVDRDPELAGIGAALEAARDGAGSLVVIAGAAGTGKSALLAVAVDRARALGVAVRSARGSELEQELSFGVIRQLFEVPVRSAPPAERERLLSGAAGAAAGLFEDAPIDHGARGDGGFATLHGLYWLATGIAAGRPLLLAIDDAHWIDEPSLRALSFLAGRIADVPIVLVITLRSHEPSEVAEVLAGLESDPNARRLELTALGPEGVSAIVRAVIPAADDALCRAVHEASGGNPLYVRELLRSLSDDGEVPTVTAIREAATASVADRVMRRVAALGPDAPRLASAMAVLGASGRLRDAAEVADKTQGDAAESARAMRRVEILGAEDPFEWIHPIVQRSIYDALTVTERDALHASAADVLTQAGAPLGVVASHLSALRPAGSATVVVGLRAAAVEALTRDAADVAVTLLQRTLAEGADTPPRSTLLLQLGQVELTRRNPAATPLLEDALRLSADVRERALTAIALAESHVFSGSWDAAADITEAGLAEVEALDSELVLELELTRALACAVDPALVSRFQQDRARLEVLARDVLAGTRALSGALAMVSAMVGADLAEVPALCEHALEDDVLISERSAGAYSPAHVLFALATIEQYEPALAFADELERAARAEGSIANVMSATGFRGWISLLRGDLAGTEEIVQPLVDTAAENGMVLFLVTALWWLTDVILERPSGEALTAVLESIELPPAFAEVAGGAWLLSTRGRVRAARGARAEAEADLRQAARVFTGLDFGPMHIPARSSLALVLGPSDRDEARALAAEELALAQRTSFGRPRGVALRACGLLAEREEGLELLRQSVVALADSPARYENARSLVEYGAALRRAGRRAEAGEPLQEGMELAHRCGAERLVARAREELLAAGAQPRKIVGYGFAQLTASERRIVRLAAEGRTNPEIAEALYVSVKTVETHLSSAYRKLGLSGAGSRRRLAELVAQAETGPGS